MKFGAACTCFFYSLECWLGCNLVVIFGVSVGFRLSGCCGAVRVQWERRRYTEVTFCGSCNVGPEGNALHSGVWISLYFLELCCSMFISSARWL
jgi:hypothetical protein